MQLEQTIFSALLIGIMAAAGLVWGDSVAVIFSALTAAVAFFALEVRRHGIGASADRAVIVSDIMSLVSWLCGLIAGVSLVI